MVKRIETTRSTLLKKMFNLEILPEKLLKIAKDIKWKVIQCCQFIRKRCSMHINKLNRRRKEQILIRSFHCYYSLFCYIDESPNKQVLELNIMIKTEKTQIYCLFSNYSPSKTLCPERA